MKILPEKRVERAKFEDARAFFLSKIESQAIEEGARITDAELAFLLQPPDIGKKEYQQLEGAIGGEPGYQQLFETCAELLKHSLEHESASDLDAQQRYERHLDDIGTEDAFWSFMAYSGVKREKANRLGAVVGGSFSISRVAIICALMFIIIQLIRHWFMK